MKSYLPLTVPQTPEAAGNLRRGADLYNARGSAQAPAPPRNILVTGGSKVLVVTWNPPVPQLAGTVTGWRIYLNTETNLIGAISDPALTTYVVTVGDTIKHNVFVSSLNRMGLESRKVQAQGSATS